MLNETFLIFKHCVYDCILGRWHSNDGSANISRTSQLGFHSLFKLLAKPRFIWVRKSKSLRNWGLSGDQKRLHWGSWSSQDRQRSSVTLSHWMQFKLHSSYCIFGRQIAFKTSSKVRFFPFFLLQKLSPSHNAAKMSKSQL